MSSVNDGGKGRKAGEVQKPDPNNAAVDPNAAARQDQIKADHDALQESARRVDASVPASVRDTPIQHSEPSTRATTGTAGDDVRRSSAPQVETDPRAAAKLDRVKADHDALEKSAQRVKASVPPDVRNTPVQPVRTDTGTDSDSDEKRNAEAARENARRSEKNPPRGR